MVVTALVIKINDLETFEASLEDAKKTLTTFSKMNDSTEKIKELRKIIECIKKGENLPTFLDNNKNYKGIIEINFPSEKYPENKFFRCGNFVFDEYGPISIDSLLHIYFDEGILDVLKIEPKLETTIKTGQIYNVDWKATINNINTTIPKIKQICDMKDIIIKITPDITLIAMNALPVENNILDVFRDGFDKFYRNQGYDNIFNTNMGIYCKDGMKVYGIIPGIIRDTLGTFAVLEKTPNIQEFLESQVEGLEIMKETFEWVLKQEEIEKYHLWINEDIISSVVF